MDGKKCQKMLYGTARYDQFVAHPCTKKHYKDGFCKIHHPEAVKMRQEISSRRWEEKMNNSPLSKAMRKIKELEEEIKRLKGE